jgi:hypothetical protein
VGCIVNLISLAEIMKPFYVAVHLTRIRTLEAVIKGAVPGGELTEDLRLKAQSIFRDDVQDCKELGLTASMVSAEKILRLLAKPPCSYERLRDLVTEFQERLIDEMSVPRFFSLSDREVKYYVTPWEGWKEIIHRFPKTITDIEEASKCFALSRYGAAVFHSVQIVESGLIELGTFIGVNDPRSGWTAVAKRLDKIVNAPYAERTDFEKQHFQFLEQAQATVEALKNAWRNRISHAQGKLLLLTRDFTPEVAEEILFATRAFMRRLADGLPARVESP